MMGLTWNAPPADPEARELPPPILTPRLLVVLAAAVAFGALLAAVAGARPDTVLPPCACGHDAHAHEHLTPGTWCGLCPRYGEDACIRYDPVRRPNGPAPDGEEQAAAFLRGVALLARDDVNGFPLGGRRPAA